VRVFNLSETVTATVSLDQEHQVVQLNDFPMEAASMAEADSDSSVPEGLNDLAKRLRRKGIDLPPDLVAERIQRLDSEVGPLVMANADVLVEASWMGRTATLEEAMIAYPLDLIEEDPSVLISIINGLLANRVENKEPVAEEEPQDTEHDDEKSDAKAEVERAQADKSKANSDVQSEKDSTVEPIEQPAQEGAATLPLQNREVRAEARMSASPARSKPEQAAQNMDRVSNVDIRGASNSSGGRPELETAINKSTPELTYLRLKAKDQLSEIKPAIKSRAEVNRQISEADAVASPIVEAKPESDVSQLTAGQEGGSLILPSAIEAPAEPGPAGDSPLDLISSTISDEVAQLSDEKTEMAEDEPALATLEHQMGAIDLIDFIEEETLLLDRLEEAGLESDELYRNNESSLSGQVEITDPEQPAQISLTIEEIEDSLIALSERIKASGPEAAEKLNQVLDKIIEVPVSVEAGAGENIITEAEAREELEELFTELLDRTGIEHTSELIESLAQLTLRWHLTIELEKLKKEEETDTAPAGSGTHEIIKKLLAGLRIIKKVMAHAGAIGKSALQLYTLNFAT
jgi:hypothetical protein